MKNNNYNGKYKIKVNRIPSENEKYPYNKYSKNESSNLNKISPNNAHLYRYKYNPEIIINEYHQTSNNINTNINIKTNQSDNSNNNTTINNINFNHQPNNYSFLKYYHREYKNINPKNNENNDKNRFNNKLYKNRFNIRKHYYNDSENNLIIKEKIIKNALTFSPNNRENNVKLKNNEYKKRDLNYMKSINYDSLNKYNKRISDYIFQSLIDCTKNNKNNTIIEKYNNYFGVCTTNNDINFRHKKNNSQEAIRSTNISKKKINRNSSLNSIQYTFKVNTIFPKSTIHSYRDKKMKEMNKIIFSSGNTLKDIFRNKRNNNLITNNDKDDKNDANKVSLNIKLEYYRIQVFKEFLKHFQIFYKRYIIKYFNEFFHYLKQHKKNVLKNNNSYLFNKNILLRNYSTYGNSNSNINQSNLLKINNNHNLNLIEFKKSRMDDNYKSYNQIKNKRNINSNITKLLNNYSIYRDNNNSYSNIKINNSLSLHPNKNYNLTYNINSVPRINKNLSNLNDINTNKERKILFTSASKSPSIRIGNKTYINNDISFGVEGNNNENKLYRDSKELKRKYEQIQRRKQKSKNKNGETSLNQNLDLSINKSADINKIKNSDEYNEFVELRKYVHRLKSKNNINQSALNINHYNNKKDNEGANSYNTYEKRIFSYNKKERNDDNDNNNINIDREKIIEILTNEKEQSITDNIIVTNNSIKKNNNMEINNFKNNIVIKNDNEYKDFQKVRVNINRRFLKNKLSNGNNKITNNYDYRIIKNNPIYNSPIQENKINYKYNNGNSKFIPILIKNITTNDKKINISIHYYTISLKNNSKKKFNYLIRSYNCSICLFGDINTSENNNISQLKFKLPSIKEEDLSNQNSKFYDENGTLDKNNTYEIKKKFY